MTKSVTFTENRPFGPVRVTISTQGIVFILGTTCYVNKGVPQYTLNIIGSLDDCSDAILDEMEDWYEPEDMLEYLLLKNQYEKIELL